MRRGGGSSKGSSFEREVCKQLSLWWTKGEREDIFWRTAGSGARATTRAKSGKTTARSYGDVIAIDPIGDPLIKEVTIEIKRGYNGNKSSGIDPLYNLDGKGDDLLLGFWSKLLGMAQEIGTEPWLIFQRDRCSRCIVYKEKLTLPRIELHTQFDDDLYIYNLDRFLWASPPEFYMKKELPPLTLKSREP